MERALPLWSTRLGLVGKADIVEFHGDTPYPVEYKYGPRRASRHDNLQLCAQAMCLEEMLGQSVPKGAIFHYSSRRRREVIFNEKLRDLVERTVEEIRKTLEDILLPPPVNDKRCRNCSLQESCLPSVTRKSVRLKIFKSSLFSADEY